MNNTLSIGICVRNGAPTIARAIKSLLGEKHIEIILIDDHSTDDSVAIAKGLAGERLKVIKVEGQGGVGAARAAGLAAFSGPYASWLDADDEWVCGRAERILNALQKGADIYSEAIDLYDGPSGKFLRTMTVPGFIKKESSPARLFERNYLPCDTQVGFRVETFRRAGGYDPEVIGPESFDILLRAVAHGARFAYADNPGYRMYAYPGSVSRQLERQRAMTAKALKKHDYNQVRAYCLRAGQSPRVAGWVLVSLALYRYEPEAALQFIDEASPKDTNAQEILEPDGPFPYPEGWRRGFARGTCLLLAKKDAPSAQAELEAALAIEPTAEVYNNLAVAHLRQGNTQEALGYLRQALEKLPGYLDATVNLENPDSQRITTHPLRRQASRSEYHKPAAAK